MFKFFKKKGVIATIIGLVFALPINIKFIIAFYNSIELSRDQLEAIALINVLCMAWFMLPSEIEIKSKIFTMVIKD